MKDGCLIISLDFEMMWGNIETWTADTYGQTNIVHVPEVIDRMLSLFEKYNVHATFATVGLIMHSNKNEAMSSIPAIIPSYTKPHLSPFNNGYIANISEESGRLFFAEEVVNKISRHKGMEIGTHTYSHYYCWESGQTIEQFETDLRLAVELAKRKGYEIRSIVFPRNQVSRDYLKVCAKYGITSYRGNALRYFGEPKNALENLKNRICRILDAYIEIGGKTTISYEEFDDVEIPINIRASRFLRPYSKRLALLEPLRLRRIERELCRAAKNGEIYHIWWHPHNWGADVENNIQFLDKILRCYKKYQELYDMKSYNMNELYQLLHN